MVKKINAAVYKFVHFACLSALMCLNGCSPWGSNIKVLTLQQEHTLLQSRLTDSLAVLFFISPECPICQGYTTTMNNLTTKYKNMGVKFIGLIPGNAFTTDTVHYFKNFYNITFDVFIDNEKSATNFFHATITPQCFLITSKMDILYQGLIDNYAADVGIKRQVVTEHYLQDALEAVLHHKKVVRNKTTPVGCFIE